MSEKKELSLDDLQEVTGGVNPKKNCLYFVQGHNKPAVRKCPNCFYYNKNTLGVLTCTHPSKSGNSDQSGVI